MRENLQKNVLTNINIKDLVLNDNETINLLIYVSNKWSLNNFMFDILFSLKLCIGEINNKRHYNISLLGRIKRDNELYYLQSNIGLHKSIKE